uniref:Uncharacterized protein n=1 Tax=Lotharella globosa TaxID=91324 RepID=A0A7S4DN56_9EUKA
MCTQKTSLLSRFVDGEFSDHFYSTIGVDFKARGINIGEHKVKVQIWDTAGQERFRTITSSYYRGAKGIMVVYNVADRLSFENANQWLEEAAKYADSNTVTMLVGNKADLPSTQRKVSSDEAREFAMKGNIPWIETSAKDGTNVYNAFEALCVHILNGPPGEPYEYEDDRIDLSRRGSGTGKKSSCC